jgi:hypothetical protein
MRDGVVSVADPGACPSASLLRALKEEFGFYCIELYKEQEEVPEPMVALVVGGSGGSDTAGSMSNMERYDAPSGQWSMAAPMGTARSHFGACMLMGDLYVSGGRVNDMNRLSTVEKFTPSSDTWSAVAPLPAGCSAHDAVAVGSAMYVLGGSAPTTLNFDSAQGVWSAIAPMPEMSLAFAACVVGSDIY